jgi:hypothetical protein
MKVRTRLSLGVVTAGSVVGALLVPATAAFATPNIVPVTIDGASTNLLNGQTVLVSGSGFEGNATVYIAECSDITDGNPAHCDATIPPVVTTTANGSGVFTDVPFQVHTGTVGDGTCDGASTKCGIAATDSPIDPTTGDAGATSISFAKIQGSPLTGLHKGDSVALTGAGLPHGATFAVVQCGPDAQPDGTGCDQNPSDASFGETDSSGNLTANFSVLTGDMASGDANSACPPPTGAANPCSIAVVQINGLTPVGVLGQLPISFAPVTKPKVKNIKTKLSAKASAKKVAKGKKFTIKGAISAAGKGVKGLTVQLWGRATKHAKWKKIGAAKKSGKKGAYAFKLKGKGKTFSYRVTHAKQKISTKNYLASTSKTVTVKNKKKKKS